VNTLFGNVQTSESAKDCFYFLFEVIEDMLASTICEFYLHFFSDEE
jgi:hypothetical protein